MLSCYDVARYFVYLAYRNRQKGIDGDHSITQLKLQKLLYYAQGFYLALYDKPLFSESICAWKRGPVVVVLWHEYNKFGSSDIPFPGEVNLPVDDGKIAIFLEALYESIGYFSPFKLSAMTHKEGPWTYTPSDSEITQEVMKLYYKNKIDDFGLREFTIANQSENTHRNQINKKKTSAFDIYLKSKGKWSGVYRRLADS